ncbi:hypothetical protein, partial [Spirochaeta cellobiosiphila]|uniref:hypothetical protein n=1 Tax=Spirochaeta cellobiosiphila TaxID=504483 RepID=UPI001B7FBE3F
MEYEKMLDQLEAAEQGFNKQVESANDNIEDSLHQTMRKDGYVLSGNVYKKDLVIGSTALDGFLTDEGIVEKYSDFTDYQTDFTSSVALNDDQLSQMNSDALNGLLDKAQQEIRTEMEEVFGSKDDKKTKEELEAKDNLIAQLGLLANDNYSKDMNEKRSSGNYDEDKDSKLSAYKYVQEIKWMEKITEKVGEKIVKRTKENSRGEERIVEEIVPIFEIHYEERTDQRGVDISPGTFGAHVGFAPSFKEDDIDLDKNWTSNVRFNGAGEMGTIMGEFIFNKMREGAGLAQASLPGAQQKVWDDRGSWLEAPTVMELTKTAVTIATLPAGGTAGMVMNLTTNAAFNTQGVVNGNFSWQQGLLDFGKSAATSIASRVIPGVGSLGSFGESLGDTIGGKITESLIDGAVNNAVSG